MPAERFNAKLLRKDKLTHKTFLFTFGTDRLFNFKPGQFINLEIDQNYRSYSICSDPTIKEKFSILVDIAHNGVGSNYLRNLNINDQISFYGPAGRFILSNTVPNTIIFIATGSGISPFYSMLDFMLHKDIKSEIQLYWGVRNLSELYLEDKLNNYKDKFYSFSYKIFLSREVHKNYNFGRVSGMYPIQTNNTHYYLCGNPNMVESEVNRLIENGVNHNNIFFEKFSHKKLNK